MRLFRVRNAVKRLSTALGRGLPVPGGVALAWDFVDRIAAGDRDARDECVGKFAEIGTWYRWRDVLAAVTFVVDECTEEQN